MDFFIHESIYWLTFTAFRNPYFAIYSIFSEQKTLLAIALSILSMLIFGLLVPYIYGKLLSKFITKKGNFNINNAYFNIAFAILASFIDLFLCFYGLVIGFSRQMNGSSRIYLIAITAMRIILSF